MKKFIATVLGVILSLCLLVGCGDKTDFQYYDTFSNEGQEFNKNLFYRNDLNTYTADPSVIYITEGEEAGWFYMYGTSDEIGASGYQTWRSKNLTDWECMGVAFYPDGDDWCRENLWAPEVIFDAADHTYYMFFNATNRIGVSDGQGTRKTQSIGMAYASDPRGPFTMWTGEVPAGKYADGTDYEAYTVTRKTPLVDFTKMPKTHPLYDGVVKVIDASPFIDDNGDKYLFFCHDLGGGGTTHYDTSSIWGMKMIDWHTPDYSTVTKLTENGQTKVTGGDTIREGSVNEAPFMIKHDGKYYLTFSVYSFEDKLYQVRQAISDSPLGTFTKVSLADGGAVIAADPQSDFMSGTGHHSFIKAGDEQFIMYHAHINRTTGSGQRAIAADRYTFVNNGTQDVIHANGPTFSLQPLPTVVSGYRNVADRATITSNNTAEGSDVQYLNDGNIKTLDLSPVPEYLMNTGTTTITMTFAEAVTARAIMIYNSYYYDTAFVQISRIEIEHTVKNKPVTATIDNLRFDWDNLVKAEYLSIGTAAIAEFDEIPVNKITITLTCPEGAENVALNEIVVLGK